MKIKEYSGCLIIVLLFVGYIVFLFVMNGNSKKENKESKEAKEEVIGKYVYIDSNTTLHTRFNCIELRSRKYSVERIETTDIAKGMLKHTCSWCVNDSIYEKLMLMASDTCQNKKSLGIKWKRKSKIQL